MWASGMKRPDFIIIGAMKGGTTSLFSYLKKHPDIFMAELPHQKSLDFFITQKNFRKGFSWYQSRFSGQAGVYGEASPNYSKYPVFSGVPERMHAVLPEIKLLYILRDPIERIRSHYIHNYAHGRETRAISDALSGLDDQCDYLASSKYYMQLQQYWRYYPEEHMLILTTEELRNQRESALQKIFKFLGVDEAFYSADYEKIFHRSSEKKRKRKINQYLSTMAFLYRLRPYIPQRCLQLYRYMTETSFEQPQLTPSLEMRLRDYLKDDVKALRQATGKAFAEWRV